MSARCDQYTHEVVAILSPLRYATTGKLFFVLRLRP